MKTKIALLALALTVTASISSCKKDSQDSNNSPSALSFKMQALNRNFSLPVQQNGMKSSTANATILWDTARLLVSKVKFEAEMKGSLSGKDSIEIEYAWRGPLTLDLFDLSATVGSITLPAGIYKEVELKVSSEKEDANGLPLFYLSGSYTNSQGNTLPIVVSVTHPIEFKTEQKGDTIIAGGSTDFTSTIQLYLDQLLLQVDPSALDGATLTNGVLLISENANHDLYEVILRNLKKDHHCEHGHHHH